MRCHRQAKRHCGSAAGYLELGTWLEINTKSFVYFRVLQFVQFGNAKTFIAVAAWSKGAEGMGKMEWIADADMANGLAVDEPMSQLHYPMARADQRPQTSTKANSAVIFVQTANCEINRGCICICATSATGLRRVELDSTLLITKRSPLQRTKNGNENAVGLSRYQHQLPNVRCPSLSLAPLNVSA